MRISLPAPAALSLPDVHQQQMDARAARFFKGTGGPFIEVPGLQELKDVRMPGLLLEKELERNTWVNGRPETQHTLVQECCFIIRGINGEPLLGRSPWSNDGIWQRDHPIIVVGIWDEDVSPVPEGPLPPMHAAQMPILTGAGRLEAGGEVTSGRPPGRPRKE